MPSAGTRTFHSAVPDAAFACGCDSLTIVQSPGIGSRTVTVTASGLAFFNTNSYADSNT